MNRTKENVMWGILFGIALIIVGVVSCPPAHRPVNNLPMPTSTPDPGERPPGVTTP